jgi:DnaK suppressor protein
MEELRRMLESKRAEILRDIKRAREDGIETDRVSFPEVGDLVSASVEKERAFEHSELGVNALREIDNALEKLQEGTYGVCELCSRPIGIKRLRVMPSARLCIRCKSEQEASSVKNPPGR